MKNLYLYEKTFTYKESAPAIKGVYDFRRCPLVGIDVDVISKRERLEIVHTARLRELFILQEWLLHFIKEAKELDSTILSIKLHTVIDEDVEASIQEGIKSYDYNKLSDFLLKTMEYYECDIKEIIFNYKKTMISIMSNGVLSISDDEATEAITDSDVLCVIAGAKNNVFYHKERPAWGS